jgi:hypothetical protein
MSLAHLIEVDLESYVADNGDADSSWFFVHIPKTAGSSFGTEMNALLSPNYNVDANSDTRDIPYSRKVADATKRFNERLKQGPCRFASGHVPVTVLASHVEGWHDLKLITMLRDPVTRVISDYRYQTTPAHPNHQRFVESFPTLLSYAEANRGRNKMYRFLRPSAHASVEDCKAFVVERFAFVGLVEMYPLSFRLVTRLLGKERAPSAHVRKTMDSAHNRIEITPELVERLRELNSLDVELYDYFRTTLHPVRQVVFG